MREYQVYLMMYTPRLAILLNTLIFQYSYCIHLGGSIRLSSARTQNVIDHVTCQPSPDSVGCAMVACSDSTRPPTTPFPRSSLLPITAPPAAQAQALAQTRQQT